MGVMTFLKIDSGSRGYYNIYTVMDNSFNKLQFMLFFLTAQIQSVHLIIFGLKIYMLNVKSKIQSTSYFQ